jgi:hypothetical protein
MSAISVSANWLDGANGDEAEAEEPMATPVFEGMRRLREVAARLWAAGQQGKPREHELSGGGDFGGAAGGDGG